MFNMAECISVFWCKLRYFYPEDTCDKAEDTIFRGISVITSLDLIC